MSTTRIVGMVGTVGLLMVWAGVFGSERSKGQPKAHNAVPVGTIMEIHAVSSIGLPDTAYVLMSPWGSGEELKFYQLEKSVPDGARCLMARKDNIGHYISFVKCPEPVAAETPPPANGNTYVVTTEEVVVPQTPARSK